MVRSSVFSVLIVSAACSKVSPSDLVGGELNPQKLAEFEASTADNGVTFEANPELETRLQRLGAAGKGIKCPAPGGHCNQCTPLRELLRARMSEHGVRDPEPLLNGVPEDIHCPPPNSQCVGCRPAEDVLRARFGMKKQESIRTPQ